MARHFANETLLTVGLGVIGCLVAVSLGLYCFTLFVMWRRRNGKTFGTFFYRLWWNQGFIDVYALVFFLTTMYARCFDVMIEPFLYMNRFLWWTKFAQITQEHIMYTQIMDVFLTVGGRLLSVCFPLSRITSVVEKLKKWQIFVLQITLPTAIIIPFYVLFNFNYGLKGTTIPLLLSTEDPRYDQYIFATGLTYRITAFLLCSIGYSYLFFEVQKKAKMKDMHILVHGACLVLALLAVLTASVCRRFQIGEKYPLMRLFFFSTMLWIPITNLFVTLASTRALRCRIVHPLSEYTKNSILFNTKQTLRRGTI